MVKDKIRTAIKEINSEYQTKVILTTHDLGDIEEICNRILIIDNGKIIYDGTVEDIKKKYGKIRKISLDLKDISVVHNVDFNKIYQLSDQDFNFTVDGKTVTYSINRDKVNVSFVISKIMLETDIQDIRIKETDISEIVKQIYISGI